MMQMIQMIQTVEMNKFGRTLNRILSSEKSHGGFCNRSIRLLEPERLLEVETLLDLAD